MSDPSTPAAPAAQAPEATQQQETFSRDYVESLRAEAAKYRTEKKDAVDAAKAEVVKTYEGQLSEKDASLSDVQKDYAAAKLDALKLQKIIEAKVPVEDILDVVTLVQGTDEESVSESVNRVKNLLGKAPASVPAVDTTQGKGGTPPPLNGNPVLDILKRAVNAQ